MLWGVVKIYTYILYIFWGLYPLPCFWSEFTPFIISCLIIHKTQLSNSKLVILIIFLSLVLYLSMKIEHSLDITIMWSSIKKVTINILEHCIEDVAPHILDHMSSVSKKLQKILRRYTMYIVHIRDFKQASDT